jgi:hypothetical protein
MRLYGRSDNHSISRNVEFSTPERCVAATFYRTPEGIAR